jgi:hypothetical protein
VYNEAPNINYLKKVYRGNDKRQKVFQKLEGKKQQEQWKAGTVIGQQRVAETKELIKSYESTT